jgi:hypothetical protein
MTNTLFSRAEIEEIVVMQRLHLYNRGLPCGAKPIRKLLDQESVRPLPSITTIKRILSGNALTYGRTGFYPGDENGECK